MKSSATKPKGVILFICDDLAWGDIACNGNPHVRTPHIDRLQAGGVHHRRHCSGPLCTPARACLLTGRNHLRTRAIDTYCGRSMLDPGESTLGHLFASANFRTGAFGKWHLGDCYPTRAMDFGFEQTLTHGAGGIGQPGDHPDNHARWKDDSYFNPVLSRNGKPETVPGYCTDIFTEAAMDLIERSHGDGEPFFAFVSSNTPHSPFIVDPQWSQRFQALGLPQPLPELYGMIENIDWNVGRLIGCLEKLGCLEDTLFLFTSDHGPCPSADVVEADGTRRHRWNAGLRGKKGTFYEGGIRVPMIWHWPARLKGGQSVDAVTSPMDLLPTFREWFAPDFSPHRRLDGESMVPLLESGSPQAVLGREYLVMQWERGDEPIRYHNAAVITDDFKWYQPAKDRAAELYDLKADPSEANCLAQARPEIAAKFRSWYDEWFTRLCRDVGRQGFDAPEIILGTRHEPETLLTQNDWRIVGEEGWCSDDLRGIWRVRFAAAGRYRFNLRFRHGAPKGCDHLRLDFMEEIFVGNQTASEPTSIEVLIKEPVSCGIEAWRELQQPLATARNGSSIAALYVEVAMVHGNALAASH